MDIISVVLGADTKKDRTKDSIKLIEYVFSSYQMIDLKFMLNNEFDTLVESAQFNIVKGISNNLSLNLAENEVGLYAVPKNKIKEITVYSELKTQYEAPVKIQDKVGKIYIKVGEETIYEIDILAKNEIRKKEIWDYLKELNNRLTKQWEPNFGFYCFINKSNKKKLQV